MSAYNSDLFPYEPAQGLKNVASSTLKIAFWNLEDQLTLANESLKKAFLLPLVQESPKLSILDLIAPADHPTYLAAKKRFLDPTTPGTTSLTIEVNCLAGSTPQKYFIGFSLVRCPLGKPQYFKAVLRNQTEQEASSAADSESAFHQAHVTVSAVNQDGIFVHCKGGLSRNVIPDVVGKHFSEVYAGSAEPQKRILRAMSGESFDIEVYAEGYWYHIWYQPLKDTRGQPMGAMWTSHPIDKQKLTEMLLRAELRHHQEAIRLREELLSMASHEIRSPLSTIAMQIDLLQSYMQDGFGVERLQKNVTMLATSGRKQITRVFDFVEKTLDVSRIHEKGLSLDRRKCDLVSLVRETIERCNDRSAKAGCKIQINAPETLIGHWDPFRMEQVIENLLSNALKYGSGRPIYVTLKADAEKAVLEVKDQGRGICSEEQKNIFGRFARAAEHKDVAGFGMGLYIVHQIVEAHKGSIRVESAPGQGAAFIVEVPLQTSEGRSLDQLHSTI